MPLKRNLKKIFDPLIKFIVSNTFTWTITSFLLRVSEWVNYQRSQYEQKLAEKKLAIHYADKIVRNGFFKGMKYSSLKSVGSSIFPKLLGSYEIELFPTLLRLYQNRYDDILDIGCAEGYYAVGLALKFPVSKIYGYDVDKEALRLCADFARHNQVESRVFLYDKCTASTLESFTYSGRTLIICDCEGYERELFTNTNINNLSSADMIIELHPFAVEGIKKYLVDLFTGTHDLSIISSYDNNRKIFDFRSSLQGMNRVEQLKSVEEGRSITMDWLIAESKSNKIK